MRSLARAQINRFTNFNEADTTKYRARPLLAVELNVCRSIAARNVHERDEWPLSSLPACVYANYARL